MLKRFLSRPPVREALAGAVAGFAVFALESVWIVQTGAVGLKVETSGPFAALFAVVRPFLPSLLGRVAALYLTVGLALGLVAGRLKACFGLRSRIASAAVFALELGVLVALACWSKAISRPAIFDDLPALRPVLGWLVDHGEPWHPRAFGLAWLGLHLAASLRAQGRRALVPWALAGGAAAAVFVAGFVHGPAIKPGRPLVVLIGIDAFRVDRLQALGGTGRVAPNVDAFVADATLFTQAYTPLAQTEPAWRSLLTARWPLATGVRYPLTAESRWEVLPTFPAAFAQAGYRTSFATDCSRFHYEGPASGFAERHEPPRGAVNFLLEKLRYRAVGVFADNALGAWALPEFVDNRALAGLHNPIAYAERLSTDWLDAAADGPALLAFHATAAHFPGDPVYPFYRRFVSPSEPLERRLRMFFSPIAGGGQGGWNRAGAEGLYDELIAQADAQVGILLSALKARGLYDEALIVLFSDHGESFHADFPQLGGATPVHGARLSEEENRILLAVKLPRSKAPAARVPRVDALVRLVDIGPTLLDLAGRPPLLGADGVSLAPLLRGEPMPPLRLYAETGFTHASPDAFDSGHARGAPRTFEAYRVRPDGIVEMSEAAHEGTMKEKDIGAFDGKRWIIHSPREDGTMARICRGECDGAEELERWLDQVTAREPKGASPPAGEP